MMKQYSKEDILYHEYRYILPCPTNRLVQVWSKKIQFGGRFNDLVRVEFPAVELEELFDKKNNGTNEIRFKKRLVAI